MAYDRMSYREALTQVKANRGGPNSEAPRQQRPRDQGLIRKSTEQVTPQVSVNNTVAAKETETSVAEVQPAAADNTVVSNSTAETSKLDAGSSKEPAEVEKVIAIKDVGVFIIALVEMLQKATNRTDLMPAAGKLALETLHLSMEDLDKYRTCNRDRSTATC